MGKITKKVLLSVPEELHRLMKAEAARAGLTMNDYATRVFAQAVKETEWVVK
jgi:predicted HicB family RNase H-like nuclease